jgi:repressor LexA
VAVTAAEVWLPEDWAEQTGTVYMLQVKGDCMAGAGIRNGDLVGVRPQSTASDGDVVVALVSGCRVLKTFRRRDGHDWLMAESRDHEPILADGVTILGVVSGHIHWLGELSVGEE